VECTFTPHLLFLFSFQMAQRLEQAWPHPPHIEPGLALMTTGDDEG